MVHTVSFLCSLLPISLSCLSPLIPVHYTDGFWTEYTVSTVTHCTHTHPHILIQDTLIQHLIYSICLKGSCRKMWIITHRIVLFFYFVIVVLCILHSEFNFLFIVLLILEWQIGELLNNH